jgi:hypothetical protein
VIGWELGIDRLIDKSISHTANDAHDSVKWVPGSQQHRARKCTIISLRQDRQWTIVKPGFTITPSYLGDPAAYQGEVFGLVHHSQKPGSSVCRSRTGPRDLPFSNNGKALKRHLRPTIPAALDERAVAQLSVPVFGTGNGPEGFLLGSRMTNGGRINNSS